MAKQDYLATGDDAFGIQLQTFKSGIGNYATTLGLVAAQTAAQAADCNYYNYVIACLKIMAAGAQQWTSWKDLTRDGGTPPVAGAPMAPTFPTAVAAVAPGVEVRFRALVKLIKANPNYNESIGEALGIEGAQQTGPDLTTVQPEIDVVVSGGRVEVDWGWQGNSAFLDLCEIQVDRGDGKGFNLLTYDSTPGYVDTAPFPAAPVKWTYKAIYRLDDAQTGQWSNPVSITVGG
jgi:hypothetical protein